MTMQKFLTQIKREIWEHKTGLLWAPATVALLLILCFLYMAAAHDIGDAAIISDFDGAHENEMDKGRIQFKLQDNISVEDMATITDMTKAFITGAVGFINFLLWLPLAIVLMVYAHGTLFDDRKNREILFWRSMPVSETHNVLTKFLIVGIVAPTIVFLLSIPCVLLFLSVDMVEILVGGVDRFGEVSTTFTLWFLVKLYLGILVNLIVLLPFFAWMIFASAFARKSPFLLSSLVPMSLIVIDKVVAKIWGIDMHIMAAFNRYWDLLMAVSPARKIVISPDLMLPFAISMLVGIVLIFATIWLRNNRYEI